MVSTTKAIINLFSWLQNIRASDNKTAIKPILPKILLKVIPGVVSQLFALLILIIIIALIRLITMKKIITHIFLYFLKLFIFSPDFPFSDCFIIIEKQNYNGNSKSAKYKNIIDLKII